MKVTRTTSAISSEHSFTAALAEIEAQTKRKATLTTTVRTILIGVAFWLLITCGSFAADAFAIIKSFGVAQIRT